MADSIKNPALDPFAEFLDVSQGYFDSIVSEIVKAVGEHDDKPLILSHGKALREQVSKVLGYTRAQFEKANSETKRHVVEFCDVQAVTVLARSARETFSQSVQSGIFGDGIFSWLESNAEEIKKLINEIWEIFGTVPHWFEALKQIIDQILKIILSLFGGVLGRNRSKISAELSNMEVEFWNEMSARRRYVQTLRNRGNEVED